MINGNHYPDLPGYKNTAPETSVVSALQAASNAERLRDQAYILLKQSPRTADECADLMRESVLAVRPRLSELHAMGKIEDTGLRRLNRSGKKAAVWKVIADPQPRRVKKTDQLNLL